MFGALLGAAASIGSSLLGKSSAEKAAKRNEATQREFAQNGIKWKVEDAKRAGIHPLYALGANTTSFSPTNVGADYSGLASAGQDIGRAIDSTRSNPERQAAAALTGAQLEGLNLDNDLKRAELASKLATVRAQVGPGLPGPTTASVWGLDGQGNAPQVDAPELKRSSTRDITADGRYVSGASPSVDLMMNTDGSYTPVMPKQLAESMESDPTGVLEWVIRNRLLTPIGYGEKPRLPGQLPWHRTRYGTSFPFGAWESYDYAADRPGRYGRFNTNMRY